MFMRSPTEWFFRQIILLGLPVLCTFSPGAFAETMRWQAVSSISYNFYLGVSVNGQSENFLLDTGSYDSMVEPDSQTSGLPSLGKTVAISSADDPQICDLVSLAHLSFAQLSLSNHTVERCNLGANSHNVLGIDALDKQIFSLKFSTGAFSFVTAEPANAIALKRSSANHIELPIEIAGLPSQAVFDSGWGITAVDSQLIASHPEIFTAVTMPADADKVTDFFGNPVQASYYKVTDLKVGSLDFGSQFVQAYTFPPDLRAVLGNDVLAVIGTSTMINADWIFDLKNNLWSGVLRSR